MGPGGRAHLLDRFGGHGSGGRLPLSEAPRTTSFCRKAGEKAGKEIDGGVRAVSVSEKAISARSYMRQPQEDFHEKGNCDCKRKASSTDGARDHPVAFLWTRPEEALRAARSEPVGCDRHSGKTAAGRERAPAGSARKEKDAASRLDRGDHPLLRTQFQGRSILCR